MFLNHSFSLLVNSLFGLPIFDWVGLMRSLNLFVNAEMTSLRFRGLFGSVSGCSLIICGLAIKQSHRFVLSQDLRQ